MTEVEDRTCVVDIETLTFRWLEEVGGLYQEKLE